MLSKRNIERFKKRFPWLERESCLAHHKAIDLAGIKDGWAKLLWNLFLEVDKEVKKPDPEVAPPFHICQIKQKFGELTVYADFGNDAIYNLLRAVRERSRTICEVCGRPGVMRPFDYVQILCKKHALEYAKKNRYV
jgi:hypothetical protein